jgi:hypothetical protein
MSRGSRVAPQGFGEADRPDSQFMRTVPVGLDIELPIGGVEPQAVDLLLHDLAPPAR